METYTFRPSWKHAPDGEREFAIEAANQAEAEQKAEAHYLANLSDEERHKRGAFTHATYAWFEGTNDITMVVNFKNDQPDE